MSSKSREIECLERLSYTSAGLQEIFDFLIEEKLTNMSGIKVVVSAPSIAKELHLLLRQLNREGKFQLIEYQWTVLPIENINITLVTDTAKREFTYSNF